MAQRARLEEGLLAVKGRSPWRPAGLCARGNVGVALQAQQVDVADSQHVRIGAAMRNMAGRAALDFYRLMLEYKRPLFVRVAGKTNRILASRGPQLPWSHGAVRIMAIAALN